MKKKIVFAMSTFLLCTATSFASVEDNSLEQAIKDKVETEKTLDVQMKNFSSCQNMEEVMETYIKDYYEANKDRYNYRRFGGLKITTASVDMAASAPMAKEESIEADGIGGGGDVSSNDYSKTNTQVDGVDEGDIVKTDGNYIYYYNRKPVEKDGKKEVGYMYIVSLKTQKIVKKLKIPDTFSQPEFYVQGDKLVVLATMYNYNQRSYANTNQTIAAIYDLGNRKKISLLKVYAIDGNLSKSRLVGNKLYVVGQKYFDIPFYDIKSVDDINISASSILPRKLEVTKTSDTSKQNVGKLPYYFKKSRVDCNSVDYNFPTKDTLKNANFSASFTIVSEINLDELMETPKTKVVAGSTAEIYMNEKNMYLTSYMHSNEAFICRGFGCIVPSYTQRSNTLIHKYGLKDGYKNSALVPGNPLTQYSMDEYKGNFRILTKIDNWFGENSDRYTNLYILDKNLKVTGTLEKLGKGEEFKSSRYIGDKLYLVTFERTDPLFVIDVANTSNPKVLGELKIPGFSTYLHPYDDKHLIGLGTDTFENKWGGIQTRGIKLDLYEINYDKKCGDTNLSDDEKKKCASGDYKGIIAKQLYTKTFGGKGSNSEALHNPRMFMWNAKYKKLFVPVELRDYNDNYDQQKDYFQGLLALSIDKNTGIKEDYRTTHLPVEELEKERKKECDKYVQEAKQCKKLLDGTEVCGQMDLSRIPGHCFEGSTALDYAANNNWKYRNYFVNRALWIGDNFYSLSPEKIQANSIQSGKKVVDVELR